MRDGQRVSYIGDPVGDVQPGDEGRILACSTTSAHVKWASGEYSLVTTDDITPMLPGMSVEATLDDSLDLGGFEVTAAHDIYDVDGPEGLLNAMAQAGHLASFENYAQEALDNVTSRIRHDPAFVAVASRLDDAEADHLVRLASAALIRDAFLSPED